MHLFFVCFFLTHSENLFTTILQLTPTTLLYRGCVEVKQVFVGSSNRKGFLNFILEEMVAHLNRGVSEKTGRRGDRRTGERRRMVYCCKVFDFHILCSLKRDCDYDFFLQYKIQVGVSV